MIVHCHCSTPIIVHCRAFLYRLPTLRAIKDHTLIQNKYLHNISYSVLYSVHHHGPSAQATPMQGVVTPATKNIWHPMWGLWLVDKNTAVRHHPQEHVSWPVANI